MGSSLFRKYSLLDMAHPLWENISGVGYTQWTALIRGHNCEEDQHVTLINLFVKLWNNLVPICNNGKRVVIKLLRTVSNVIFAYF